MKKKIVNVFLVMLLAVSMIWEGIGQFQKPDYILAAHYFADEWPINFWNAEWDNIDQDLEQIKDDGFNTVIIVIPWREFQTEIQPVRYNDYAFSRLEEFMEAAQKAELMVQIRLGYLNDYYGDDNSAERFYDILSDENTKVAWFEYAEKIYKTCSQYYNFGGGFITWEDFWHNYMLIDYVGGTENSVLFSVKDGFPEYLSEKYTIEEFNSIYQTNFMEFWEIGVPQRSDLYAEEWFYFIDQFTIDLLVETRNYFPNLFMEVRTDGDKVGTHSGEVESISHKDTWDCGNGEFTTIMYKPVQGTSGIEGKVSAEKALDYLEKWLDQIYQNNGKRKIFIDQFLYVDNTPGYEGGNIIYDEEMPLYFAGCTDSFKKYTNGYGVWVYRDYGNNMLFNPQFALGLEGWEYEGEVYCENRDGSNKLFMSSDSEVMQLVPQWRIMSGTQDTTAYFCFDYETSEPTKLVLMVGKQQQEYNVEGEGKACLEFMTTEDMTVHIYSDGNIILDNIMLYNFVQSQSLYSMEGKELSDLAGVRLLNKLMSE